ncbi:M61 family metallopeptidase [Xanthomonas cassavae CFBP 4642]|uniref:M61 family metallopeptidase n=1 Tax=Xanthomonas cassavae CFBP 4642 TaxID=1219375 RepID=A0ABS8HL69_9XANT|nr:M61 family metallopeptidase [Xanthomonas cassavae]MCC4622071.1 M61 family metallopeptidase [Xanthomonas cassavae CFBP 4642]
MTIRFPGTVLLSVVLAVVAIAAFAQSSAGPVYLAPSVAVPPPVDRPFDGVMEVRVDASDVARRIFNVQQRVPVAPGATATLLYPRWEAASHGPSLTVTDLAGLQVSAAGRRLKWRRDAYEPHAFHVELPAGTRAVDVQFQMVAGGDLLTRDIVSVPWQRLLLYPAGWYARNIPVAATLTLPGGLRPFSALDVEHAQGARYRFRTTSLETLLDAPVLAGRHTAQLPLSAAGAGAVSLDVVALRPGDLHIPPARVAELQALVAQLRAVFGPPPFARYAILARLSDEGSSGGTEHRASSENGLALSHFQQWPEQLLYRDLIAHEIVHAWNGFYRTPADLWAPTPNVPVSGSLLWMYEGQTEFWGRVLATRAGQFSADEVRDRLAIEAAEIAQRPGRAWRPLSDDVHYPAFMLRQPVPWRDWQRRRDYYAEGVMLWLAVDAELRARSGGDRGLDDFARGFFAGATPDAPTRTYTFDDICAALNAVAPADWAGFLRGWIDAHDELDTTRGLTQHGWALVYTDTPTAAFRASENEAGVSDLSYSIGLAVRADGMVRTVAWNGPAFAAGLRPGTRLLTVNGARFNPQTLRDAVRGSTHRPIVLGIAQDDHHADVAIAYTGPLRYPRLQRRADRPDTLARLLAPR